MILTAIVPGRDGMGFTAERSAAELGDMLGEALHHRAATFQVFDLDDVSLVQRGAIEIHVGGRPIDLRGRVFAPTPISLSPLREQKLITLYGVLLERGIPLLNRSFRSSPFLEFDKWAMQAAVSPLGIPCIPTMQLDGFAPPEAVLERCAELGFHLPLILKPNRLSNGVGVVRCEERAGFLETVRLVQQLGRDYLIQPFVQHEGDLRVFLSRSEIYGFSLRRPGAGDFRGNLSSGARWIEGELPDALAQWCFAIARRCDADYIVLDWLETEMGFLFNEMCSTLGAFMGIYPAMHARISARIVDIALDKLKAAE
ncbi:MAG TPA: hypothetical protein VEZ20_02955 [Allosphingosinicella sp.]|nr:hypothetical protein [Allosphingosinicella sp.]